MPPPGDSEPSALLVVEDTSEVLRAQRLEAWAAMAQIIAHEIKNPLTPIRLSTEHLREVWRRDRAHSTEVFDRCTDNILRQVEELRSIASEFSTYSRILSSFGSRAISPRPCAEVVEGYRAAPPEGVSVELEADGPISARFDAKLLGRAVRNLMENALRASAGSGRVTVRVELRDGRPGSPSRTKARASGRRTCRGSSTPISQPTTPARAWACRSPAGWWRSTAARSPPATGAGGGWRW